MSRRKRKRNQAQELELSGINRILHRRYKYFAPALLIIIGAGIGGLFGLRQAVALAALSGILGFTYGVIVDSMSQRRIVNPNPLEHVSHWA